MGLLGDVYSYGDTLKRKVGGLLNDPRAVLEQFVGQLGDDMNTNISNMKTGYGFGGNKSVLSDPAQVQAAQRALADYGAQSGMAAATVWHGSPHKFNKFDSSKIGTGEGAQAYGHGLYLAENPKVATEYSKMGSAAGGPIPSPLRFINGQEVQPGTGAYKAASLLDSMSVSQAKKTVNGWLQSARPDEAAYFKEVSDTLAGIGNKAAVKQKPPGGSLYKVDLPDDAIAKMLDWDKPLSQQPRHIQDFFEPVVAPTRALEAQKPSAKELADWGELAAPRRYDPTGMELMQLLNKNKEANAANVLSGGTGGAASSAKLRQAGIPGIRYLDGGSRGAGQGSSNFVVFPGNEGLLSILERNGQALK